MALPGRPRSTYPSGIMAHPSPFWIYMLECDNGAYYTGYTTNLVRRFRQHIDGTANVRYTRSHRPVRIAQCWRLHDSVGCALKVERLIKSGGRRFKERLVRDPSELGRMAASKLGGDIDVAAFDPRTVERAARALSADDVRTAADPFAAALPTDP